MPHKKTFEIEYQFEVNDAIKVYSDFLGTYEFGVIVDYSVNTKLIRLSTEDILFATIQVPAYLVLLNNTQGFILINEDKLFRQYEKKL